MAEVPLVGDCHLQKSVGSIAAAIHPQKVLALYSAIGLVFHYAPLLSTAVGLKVRRLKLEPLGYLVEQIVDDLGE
jgi:hypothetical protein